MSKTLSVIERRLHDPFGIPSRDIPLKGNKMGWVVRTFCADPEHPNRHYDAVHRLGWTPVTELDLVETAQSLGFTVSVDNRVVRGDKGQEVLMAMPREDFDRIQARKAEVNTKSLRGESMRNEVATVTGKEHGDEAGSHTFKNFSHKEIVEPI